MKLAKVIKPPTLAQAKRRMENLRQDFNSMQGAWYDLAKKAERAIMAGDLHALGLSFDDWLSQWAADGEGRTTMRDSLRIVKELAALPEATIRAMPKVNALELTRLPKSKRLDPELVRLARNMPTRDFQKLIRAERNGKDAIYQQDFRTLKVESLRLETYEQIKRFESRFVQRAGCPDDKPSIPWTLIGAYMEMVTDAELNTFFDGVSAKMAGVA